MTSRVEVGDRLRLERQRARRRRRTARHELMVDEVELDRERCGDRAAAAASSGRARVTCSAMPHQWLIGGASASATLPTICVHRCSVAYVSFHASYGSAGQGVRFIVSLNQYSANPSSG